MQLNEGIYGASRQSWDEGNPRTLLLRLIEKNRHLEEAGIRELFLDRVRKKNSEDVLIAVINYWFTNNFRSLTRTQREPASREDVANLVASEKRLLISRVKILLLEMLMPSGVRLRDSDKAECKRAGGWFSKIADHLAEGQRVGDVFDEEHLRRIYLAKQ